MFERKIEEKIKRDTQRSREQGKGQLSLKDFKLYQKWSVNVSWRAGWMLRWECNCVHDEAST
jgi:hypothetical protein